MIIAISGVDGSGKSTLIKSLVTALAKSHGGHTRVMWFRTRKRFAAPLLILFRIIGITRYECIGGHRFGRYHLGGRKFLRFLYLWTLLLDARLARKKLARMGVWGKEDYLILDRAFADWLVDALIHCGGPDKISKRFWNEFISLCNSLDLQVFVEVEILKIVSRRRELEHDPFLAKRAIYYQLVFSEIGNVRLDGAESIINNTEYILKQCGVGAK